ncbi:MAG: helicase, partial [Gammaproteobacteria bacterium]|nr:helicase [Gammaproteobacteria bacterium]
MDYALARKDLVAWLRKQLLGPAASSDELLRGTTPIERYASGVLFPVIEGGEGIDPASLSDDDTTGNEEADAMLSEQAEPASRPRRYTPPSSVGVTFYIHGEDIRFQILYAAASYTRTGERDEQGRFKGREYQRAELGGDANAIEVTSPRLALPQTYRQRFDLFAERSGGNPRAGLEVLWRPYEAGWITTVSLFNKQIWDTGGEQHLRNQWRNERSLFQVALSCLIEQGAVGDYPRVDKSLLSDEEQELEVQYGHKRIYAVGHGAAADWQLENDQVKLIWCDFLPSVEVPRVTVDGVPGFDDVLRLSSWSRFTRDEANDMVLLGQLEHFVKTYGAWIADRRVEANSRSPDELPPANRIVGRMESAYSRMLCGLALLQRDDLARKAFQTANRAMLMQMMQADSNREKVPAADSYRWRPFQLAFLLTVLESAINEHDAFRDLVDLVWFPTGGGKTEAYLGLIAFLIVWRRLRFSTSGGGTTVLMRYTLRLLTAQQYLRATRLICALELIRREDAALGSEPISIGIWVGAASTPNTFAKAFEAVKRARAGHQDALKGLVLDACPWCGTPFSADRSFAASERRFDFFCRNDTCEFGGGQADHLPCNLVDEALYQTPPTLLLGTIDKFARLTWDERTSAFFGLHGNRPPELIIQDELHLIAGALGSVAGLYEAALDTVLIQRGVYPKYVAATATIRMAADQVRRLYGRELAVFPPPGLSSDDSFFSRTVASSQQPGRLYLGHLAPLLSRSHCLAPLAATLQVAPEAVFTAEHASREALLDAWWTQIVYHGSLRGVGNSHNAFNIDVRNHAERLIKEICNQRLQRECTTIEQETLVERRHVRIAQLTSLATAEENARTFARLEIARTEGGECVDVALATNMIAVGLDVARLALMIVNGQPLTTAE